MFVTAIIAAGGRGQRFGADVPKQLVTIEGRSILERTATLFLSHPAVDEVIVALPADLVATPPGFLRDASKPVRLVAGGARRQDSVENAFVAASGQTDIVVVHDAARPFASPDLISRTIHAAAESGAAVSAVPSRDTVKRALPIDGRPDVWMVKETIPRESIFLVQTPQAFRKRVLASAFEFGRRSGAEATDEARLVELSGQPVTVVEGEMSNMKITAPDDVALAETIARRGKAARTGRAGIGYDLHRLVTGRPLILGGVTIPFDRGLAGHSDADAVCHAIADAVLGAAVAGDIGRHFPDTDPQWHGASSIDLLRRVRALLLDLGLEVGNVDASVIAERPKLLPYIDEMRRNIAGALGIDPNRVSIKGKTNEGVGELGRGEAIAVHAIALVRQA